MSGERFISILVFNDFQAALNEFLSGLTKQLPFFDSQLF
jgi:hypothetical protein